MLGTPRYVIAHLALHRQNQGQTCILKIVKLANPSTGYNGYTTREPKPTDATVGRWKRIPKRTS
jgi:hypothetical protein